MARKKKPAQSGSKIEGVAPTNPDAILHGSQRPNHDVPPHITFDGTDNTIPVPTDDVDVPQVTNYDDEIFDGPADTVATDTVEADPAPSKEITTAYVKQQERLDAAEDLIQAQSDLLDAWTLRKNRNRAMDKVFNARNAWMKAVNDG